MNNVLWRTFNFFSFIEVKKQVNKLCKFLLIKLSYRCKLISLLLWIIYNDLINCFVTFQGASLASNQVLMTYD